VRVLAQHAPVLFEGAPVNVALVIVLDEDAPVLDRPVVAAGLAGLPVDHPRPVRRPAEGVGAGIDGVVQHLHHAVVGRLAPRDLPQGAVALHHRELDVRRAQPQEDLAAAAELAELGEDQPDCLLDTLVGIHLDPVVLAPAEARRQGEAQLAPSGLRVAGGQAALSEQAEFVFRHRSLQPEQQPVVHQARIVDPFGVDHQGTGQGAEVDQMMPVPPVAGQPRGLDAVDRPHRSGADLGDQSLEAWPGHLPRA
jgi:hypothetical protein